MSLFILKICVKVSSVFSFYFTRNTLLEREGENSELYYTRIKILGSCLFLQSIPANLHANRLHIDRQRERERERERDGGGWGGVREGERGLDNMPRRQTVNIAYIELENAALTFPLYSRQISRTRNESCKHFIWQKADRGFHLGLHGM